MLYCSYSGTGSNNYINLCFVSFQVKKSPPNEVVIFNPQTEEWAKKTVDVSYKTTVTPKIVNVNSNLPKFRRLQITPILKIAGYAGNITVS